MAVANGQTANQTTFNNAYMSRDSDTSTTGVVDLNNSTDVNSGAQITNTQQYINEIADTVGITSMADANRTEYATNNVGADGDSHKEFLEKLDASYDPATTTKMVTSINATLQGNVNIDAAVGSGVVVTNSAPNVHLSLDGFSRALLTQVALADNTSSATLISASTTSANSGRRYNYTITRGAGNVRIGTVYVINDGTNTSIVDSPLMELGDCGVTFSTDIQTLGGLSSQTLLYTTTSTGTGAKLLIEFMNFPKPV